MFQKTAHKSMMNALCRRMFFKAFNKSGIFYKKAFQKRLKIRILNTGNITGQLLHHRINRKTACRQVIPDIVFLLLSPADTADIDLQRPLKARDLTVNLNKIQRFKMFNPVIQFPYFGIHCACFILKNHRIIAFTGFCFQILFVFT